MGNRWIKILCCAAGILWLSAMIFYRYTIMWAGITAFSTGTVAAVAAAAIIIRKLHKDNKEKR